MIEPAILYIGELTEAFNRTLYTKERFWYEGGIENYDTEIKEEADKFQYAITKYGQLLGYISFRVDWYSSCAYNFGLIKFEDVYSTEDNKGFPTYHSSAPIIASAIREVIRQIQSFNLHRIDFKCVGGNPAEKGYDGIIERFHGKYKLRKVDFRDNIRDTQGNYHDTIMYELIKMEGENNNG